MSNLARPHLGYHGPRGRQRFFEGWYYRISLPGVAQSLATIYSIEDPHGGSPFSQGMVQVLTRDGFAPHAFAVENFWAAKDDLAFGQGPGLLSPEDFWSQVNLGYQATGQLNQGQTPFARWCYQIQPITGWGKQEATMGLLSYLPVYEVGWQITMAHGWGTGFFEWQGQRYDFEQAPVYIEKNWGLGYPQIWFWLQCNSWHTIQGDHDPHLTLTSGGGLRKTLGWTDQAAMIGLHYRGRFYNFRSETGQVRWHTSTQGPVARWSLWGGADGYEIELEAQIPSAQLLQILGPSHTATMHPISLHSLVGVLNLSLYRGRHTGRRLILQAHSTLAAVECGGDDWSGQWSGQCG